MGKSLVVTREMLEEIVQSDEVRRALRAKTARVLPRAQRLAHQAGRPRMAAALTVEEGTRPGTNAGGFKRSYARVTVPLTDAVKAEHGKLTLRQVLLRASYA